MTDARLLVDVPSSNPALGFGDIASGLSRILVDSKPQFATGIFGGWGSGKTTLMETIERDLDRQGVVTVRFNAWRHEKEEHLIVPLLDCVREELVAWGEARQGPVREKAIKTAGRLRKVMRAIASGVSISVGVSKVVGVAVDPGSALAKYEELSEAEEEANEPSSFYHASFRALDDAFAEFVADEDGTESDRRIVVFIDDLDRCFPENALQVLESMKLFFDLPGFIFVVGLDHTVVEDAVTFKYKDRGSASEVKGTEYIKKLFQVPYRLAPVASTQLGPFLTAAYEEAQLSPAQRQELHEVVEPHLRYLVGETANPREIKRYFNLYTLQHAIYPNLVPGAVLALQTAAFKPEWKVVDDGVLEYRGEFVAALARLVEGGDGDAMAEVDDRFRSLPPDFLEYVGPGRPGNALLHVDNIDAYLLSGESVRSTVGPELLGAIRLVAKVRVMLREDDRAVDLNIAHELESNEAIVDSVSPRAMQLLRRMLSALMSRDEDSDARAVGEAAADELLQILRRAYRAGDITGSAPTA
jgi:hypothetical protein